MVWSKLVTLWKIGLKHGWGLCVFESYGFPSGNGKISQEGRENSQNFLAFCSTKNIYEKTACDKKVLLAERYQ